MYIYEDIVKYSEIDKNGELPLYGILEYFQNCINFHGLETGQDYQSMEKKGKAWVLIAWKIKVNKFPKLYDKLKVGTWSCGNDGIYGRRNYVLMDENDQWFSYADTKWILIDIESRMPMRINSEDLSGYISGEPIDMPASSKRLKLSSERVQMPKERVYKSYIDTNGHMNNTAYFRLAQEFVPDDMDYNTVDVVYVKETTEGTVIVPYVHKENNGIGISFEGEDETIFTKMKFYKED